MTPIDLKAIPSKKKGKRLVPLFLSKDSSETADLYEKMSLEFSGKTGLTFADLNSAAKRWQLKGAKLKLYELMMDFMFLPEEKNVLNSEERFELFLASQKLRASTAQTEEDFHASFEQSTGKKPWLSKDDLYSDIEEIRLTNPIKDALDFEQKSLRASNRLLELLIQSSKDWSYRSKSSTLTSSDQPTNNEIKQMLATLREQKDAVLHLDLKDKKQALQLEIKCSDLR